MNWNLYIYIYIFLSFFFRLVSGIDQSPFNSINVKTALKAPDYHPFFVVAVAVVAVVVVALPLIPLI